MYGLPDDFDPNIFAGRVLDAITFAENIIVLAFDGSLSVSISGSIPYCTMPEEPTQVDKPPVSETRLVRLIGRAVTAPELRSPWELRLHFEGGGLATLLDHSEGYESYNLSTGDREIIV